MGRWLRGCLAWAGSGGRGGPRGLVLLLSLAGVAGCPPPAARVPLEPLSQAEAIAIVNDNALRLTGTLQAQGGHASGYFADLEGVRRSFDYDAAVLVRPPRLMRFDMTALGKSCVLFGSSESRYWIAVKPEVDTLWWGRYDREARPEAELAVRPDLIVESLGLSPLPEFPAAGANAGAAELVQRILDDRQELLFVDIDRAGRRPAHIRKEYWLSRFEPRLVERIIFRDADGRAIMDSRLSNYRPVTGGDAATGGGPLVAHRIEADWPQGGGHLVFTAARWRVLPEVDETHPAFTFPLDRRETFRRVVEIDARLSDRFDLDGAPDPDLPTSMPSPPPEQQ